MKTHSKDDSADTSTVKQAIHFRKAETFLRCLNESNITKPSSSIMLSTNQISRLMKQEKKSEDDSQVYLRGGRLKEKLAVTELRHAHYMLKHFITMRDYCEEMCFGKTGYYTTGKINFYNDYRTHASMGNTLAMGFAYQILNNFLRQRDSGRIDSKTQFHVLECGAGNGDLSFNILTIIYQLASEKPRKKLTSAWKDLWMHIHYHIAEKSPVLVERQRKRNSCFAAELTVHHCDALKLQDLKKEIKGNISIAISNELLDMLPPHELRMDEDRNLFVGVVIPHITERALFSYMDKGLSKENALKLLRQSEQYQNQLRCRYPDRKEKNARIILSRQNFLELHKIYSQEKITNDNYSSKSEPFSFKTVYIPAEAFPEVMQFIERNPSFFSSMQPNKIRYVSTDMDRYLEGINSLLCQHGEVITVDYGNCNTKVNDDHLRTYSMLLGHAQRNPFLTPGHRDITVDVNFSMLASEGIRFGIYPHFFGEQAELLPIAKVYSSSITLTARSSFYNNSFKMLSQLKR